MILNKRPAFIDLQGVHGWLAPETVGKGEITAAANVWSYGITLWEMFTYGKKYYQQTYTL